VIATKARRPNGGANARLATVQSAWEGGTIIPPDPLCGFVFKLHQENNHIYLSKSLTLILTYQTKASHGQSPSQKSPQTKLLSQRHSALTPKHKRARAMVPNLRRRLKVICSVQLSHPKTLNLCDRLLSPERDAQKLFPFLTRPGMPPTNNHAERALRGPVLPRKISFGSRSDAGARAFAVLATSSAQRADKTNPPSLSFTPFSPPTSPLLKPHSSQIPRDTVRYKKRAKLLLPHGSPTV
jgi:hypothetical protein